MLPDPETEGSAGWCADHRRPADAWTELATGASTAWPASTTAAPLQLIAGAADVGPVWLTEALYQRRLGMPVEVVRLPADQNRRGRYGVAVVARTTEHPEAAKAFVQFLLGAEAQVIYADYGFEPAHRPPEP